MKSMKKWLLMSMTALSVVTFAAGCSGDTEEDTGTETEENMEEESNTEESNNEE